MLFSVHIADLTARDALGVLRTQRRLREVPGLVFGVTMLTVPLRSSSRPPLPELRRVGLIAGWRDAASHERFLLKDPLAARLESGFGALLEPLRVWGAWSDAGPIPTSERVDDGTPVAGLTLGRTRLRRTLPFLAASAGAERAALRHFGMLAGTAFSRPPRLVATFSLWRSVAAVRDYAAGGSPGHRDASASHHARPFHHEAVFIRLRPLETRGELRRTVGRSAASRG